MPELLPVARDCMAPSYPELADEFDRISQYAYAEEDAFLSTLRAGTTILDTAIAETKSSGGTTLSGDKAFQLHDTYGFPIDLTLEIAAEQGLTVDQDGFRRLMADQRSRAKADAQARKTGHVDLSAYRSVARRRRPGRLHRLRRGAAGSRGYGRCCPPTASRSTRRARATPSSWSSTRPRSTPRAAASSPTTA